MPKKAKVAAGTARSGTPMPIKVQEDEDLRPLAVTLESNALEVLSIDERWEDEAAWWELEPVSKMHYQVTLEDDGELTVFRNMKRGAVVSVDPRRI